MKDSGLKQARQLTGKGFHYDNLLEMAKHCRGETNPEKTLSAYILNHVFSEIANELGEGPVFISELRKLEAKYRTAVNHAPGKRRSRSHPRGAEQKTERSHPSAVEY